MRKTLLTILITIMGIPLIAQDIHFSPAIVSAGGSSGEGSSVTLSRWRLAPVHVITLPVSKIKEFDLDDKADWDVTLFPNPVGDVLNLTFVLPEEMKFFLRVTDMTGRIIFTQDPRSYLDGMTVDLDFSNYHSALYLLQVSSPDLNTQKVFRIQKN